MAAAGGSSISYLLVTKGVDLQLVEGGARYTRDSVRSVLQLLGVKPRHAYKVAAAVFNRVNTLLPELQKPAHRRADGVSSSWAVWPHNPEDSTVFVSLPRSEFLQLINSCLTECKYKYAPTPDELKVACR